MFTIIEATNDEHYRAAGHLFKEYADSLDFTLAFQSFEDELTILPKMYGPPDGALLLVGNEGEFVGAAGLRRIENDVTCEIKRMFIQPGFQGAGMGKALMNALIQKARQLGYQTIKLDTLGPKMPAAVKLYKSFGFVETVPYNFNPHEGVLYFEKQL